MIDDTSQCSCGAMMRWVRTERGRKMPLDFNVTTTEDWSVTLYSPEGKRLLPSSSAGPRTGYVPHWASCPHRARYIRPRPAGRRATP